MSRDLRILKKEKGITLIALVVTIVILLILAGITLNLLSSENGLFDRATNVKAAQKRAEIEDKLGIANMNYQTEKAINKNATEKDYFEEIKNVGLITDTTIGGENISDKGTDEEGNKVYEIITDDGILIEIIVTPEKDITSEYQGEVGKLLPRIKSIRETNVTTNSIEIEVKVDRYETLNYYYKLEEETNYKELKKDTQDLTAIYNSLKQGKVYDIKVVAKNENGETEKIVKIYTGEILTGKIEQDGETIWSEGLATIKLKTEVTGVTIEYSINDSEWKEYEGEIIELENTDVVKARFTDGVNATDVMGTINVLDETNPIVNNFEVTTYDKESITTQVQASDAETGISEYKFEYKISTYTDYTEAETISTEENSYTYQYTGLAAGTTYDLRVTVYDAAENSSDSFIISQATKVANVAPSTPTATFSSKTSNSITINATATDADGDSLTYKLYTSTSSTGTFTEKATSSATSSGTTVSLTASGLSNYTTYYYYVTVTDGNATVTGSTSTGIITYCPVTTQTCGGGTRTTSECLDCSGTGFGAEYCCSWCGLEYEFVPSWNTCPYCNWYRGLGEVSV